MQSLLIPVDRLVQLVDAANAHPAYALLYYCVYAVGVMFLPITMFPIIGGVLLPFWLAFPLNVMAATVGGWFSFMVTRTFGRHAVEPYLKGRVKSWDKITKSAGFKTVVLLRLVGVPPFILSNYALGLSQVRHFDFILGTMIGILPWMGIVTYLSHSLWIAVQVGGQEGLAKALWRALGPLMLVSAMILVVVLIKAALEKRRHPHHSNL